MTRIVKESELVDCIIDFLNKQEYNVSVEIPNMGQSADIVARKGRWLTIIEAKIHDWKRAIKQCKAHESVADYICVAVSSVSIAELFIERAQYKGYGIIHCDPQSRNCKWFIHPKVNKKVWLPQRRQMIKHMRNINNGY